MRGDELVGEHAHFRADPEAYVSRHHNVRAVMIFGDLITGLSYVCMENRLANRGRNDVRGRGNPQGRRIKDGSAVQGNVDGLLHAIAQVRQRQRVRRLFQHARHDCGIGDIVAVDGDQDVTVAQVVQPP